MVLHPWDHHANAPVTIFWLRLVVLTECFTDNVQGIHSESGDLHINYIHSLVRLLVCEHCLPAAA